MFTNTLRHFHTCAVDWLANEQQPLDFTCKTWASFEPTHRSTGLNQQLF